MNAARSAPARTKGSLACLSALTLLALTGALTGSPAMAQERAGPTRDGRALPERVYVPIEDFDRIFDKERGGVFVPMDELRALIDRANARPEAAPAPVVEPPTDYVLVGARFQGVASERVVRFEATFDVEVLEDRDWVVIPIALGEAALEEVTTTLGDAVVGPLSVLQERFAARPRRGRAPPPTLSAGYGIVVQGRGKVRTTARFAVPIQAKPGVSSFELSLPGAALTHFEVSLPQSGLEVAVDQALATEASSIDAEDRTQVRAYFGAASKARVTWNPKPKELEGATREPLLFARTETALSLDEGVLKATARIDYQVLQAPCGTFKVRVPKGYTLLGVQGENLADTATEEDAQGQVITVRLLEKAKDKYALELELERLLPEGTKAVEFPRVLTVGTERESGVLAARASEFISLEPRRVRGLTQIDASALSPALAKALAGGERVRPPLVFRYLKQPFELELSAERIEPEVEGRVVARAVVRDDEVTLAALVHYTIRKRGIFDVRLRLPQGFALTQPLDEATVKDHKVLPASDEERARGLGDVLHVDFVNQVQPGEFLLGLVGTIKRAAQQPDEGKVPLSLPRITLLDVKDEKGTLLVGSQTHLKLSETGKRGLVPMPASDERSLRAGPGEELTFAYKYNKAELASAEFTVEKREPKVTARVETLVDAQEDLVRVETTINYTVEYAGVEQVRFAVPPALQSEDDLKFEGEGLIKDRRMVLETKAGVERAIWTVSLQGKRTGEFALRLKYDLKLTDFAAGQQKDVSLHELEVLDCFNETGDIALKKHENLVITEAAMVSMEKRDKRELPDALRRQGPIHAYRYVSHPHRLALRLTKYDFQAPLGVLVKHLHVDEVLTADGQLKAEVWLALQNNAEQFLTVLLPAGAVVRGLKVDGRNEEWSVGEVLSGRPTVQVHLGEVTKTRREEPFLIRLRYDVPATEALGMAATLTFQTPGFPLEGDQQVPVARLTRKLHLPVDYAYLELDTDATKHFDETSLWRTLKEALGVRTGQEGIHSSRARDRAEQAIGQLRTMPPGRADAGLYPHLELPTSLYPYLFEKLDNSSRLTVTAMRWPAYFALDALVLLGVIGLGLVLASRRLLSPAAFVGGAAGLAVLGGAFLGRSVEPFFATALVGTGGLGGFFLLRGLWRELTVNRHARRLAELDEEARAAQVRAEAAETEARLRAMRGDVVAPVAPAGKKGQASSAEREAAARIRFEGPQAPDGPTDGSAAQRPDDVPSATAPDAADAGQSATTAKPTAQAPSDASEGRASEGGAGSASSETGSSDAGQGEDRGGAAGEA